jgi:hypothetical protein
VKVTLEPTPLILEVNGTHCRQWTGTTDTGQRVVALVAAIGVPENAPPAELERFQRELRENVPELGRAAVLIFDAGDAPDRKRN